MLRIPIITFRLICGSWLGRTICDVNVTVLFVLFLLGPVQDSACYRGWGRPWQLLSVKVEENAVRTSLNSVISTLVNSEWLLGRTELASFRQFKSYQGSKPRNVSCTLKCSTSVSRS